VTLVVTTDRPFDPVIKMCIDGQRSDVNLDEPDQTNDVWLQCLIVSQE
jgi:hypothetical protein